MGDTFVQREVAQNNMIQGETAEEQIVRHASRKKKRKH